VNDEGRQHKTNHFGTFVHNQMKNKKSKADHIPNSSE